ncbi:dual specificity protein phosphatase [Plasmodium gaboni]|uniref:protein-tyrosine-phosphatase n=1 Tax=Plasmodium gaboni TaxID=647221 RepID=A0A151LVK1_9APIC|nr:dual specificity protein phosphatase [Plasmodium gaboni]KYO03206.1 dual specificity protein phosphatase [Plasmodium gaboni]
MIVKVFDSIYISNVYNANDIYELIKLNIGGVLTCFDCKCIEWCSYNNINVTNKIFYKDIFVNSKKDLLKYDSPTINNKTINTDIETQQNNNNDENNNSDEGTCNKLIETQTTSIDNSEIKCDHINDECKEHYDYIIFPSDIINNNNNIKDYIKSMLILKEDAYIDFELINMNDKLKNNNNNNNDNICDDNNNNDNICDNNNNNCRSNNLDVSNTSQHETEHMQLHKSNSLANISSDNINCCNKKYDKNLSRSVEISEKDKHPENSLLYEFVNKDKINNKINQEGDKSSIEKNKLSDNNMLHTHPIYNVCELNKCLRENKLIPYNNIYKMKHLYLNILDTFDENILKYVNKAHTFIDSVIQENKNILIHCMAGISRCSSIILSYVSKKNKKGIESNFNILKSRYPFAHPNDNFYRQLLLYEKMNYTLDGCTDYHNIYKKIKMNRKNLEDLKILNLKNNKQPIYNFRCKHCNYVLFNDNEIIKHDLKISKIKKNYGNSCTSIFIEKKEWILTENKMKGVLNCPNANCNIKLGKWSWTGICCSCGYLQIPAFMINSSNVDRMNISKTI